MDNMQRVPVPWHHLWRAAEALGVTTPKSPVIFECVGVPGVIDQVIANAPLFSRVVVVGVCMGTDRIRPAMAINKEIDLRFVLGYTPIEFRDTLHMLAEGKVDAGPLVTGAVGLDGVEEAFQALRDPEAHAVEQPPHVRHRDTPRLARVRRHPVAQHQKAAKHFQSRIASDEIHVRLRAREAAATTGEGAPATSSGRSSRTLASCWS